MSNVIFTSILVLLIIAYCCCCFFIVYCFTLCKRSSTEKVSKFRAEPKRQIRSWGGLQRPNSEQRKKKIQQKSEIMEHTYSRIIKTRKEKNAGEAGRQINESSLSFSRIKIYTIYILDVEQWMCARWPFSTYDYYDCLVFVNRFHPHQWRLGSQFLTLSC